MITGRIAIHKEPKKWKQGYYQQTWEQELAGNKEKPEESELTELLNLSKAIGFEVGARVKRASGWGEHGTIIQISSTLSMAWSYTKRQLEPFLVKWDPPMKTSGYTQAFSYHPDELNIVKENKPALLTLIESHIE